MSATVFVVILIWLCGITILGIGMFREPDRYGKKQELYETGVLNYWHDVQRNQRFKMFGAGLIFVALLISWIFAP